MVRVFYMLCLVMFVNANDFEYSIKSNIQNPYQNEGVLLEVNLTQTDHSKVMFFNFKPKESPNYSFYQVGFKEHEKYHDLSQSILYLIYPKVIGTVLIEFEFVKSLTNDDNVAYAISGDRDNVKGLEKEDIVEELKPLSLSVKALPKGTDIVGDFKLSYHLDKTSTDAYDPIHLKVILQGKGEVSPFDFIHKDKAYHLFGQKPKKKTLHTRVGTNSALEWDYAFSAKESFILPKVTLKAFDPKTKKSYDLIMPQQKIEVKEVKPESLLDKTETPSSYQSQDWSWLGTIFSYLLVFVSGLLMPRDIFKKRIPKERSFEEQVREAKTEKELLKLLLVQNSEEYKEAINDLEKVLYKREKISLDNIKKRCF